MKHIEIDILCRGACGKRHTYKPPLVRSGGELQHEAIEKYLRRLGWTGATPSMFVCGKCSAGEEARRHEGTEAAA